MDMSGFNTYMQNPLTQLGLSLLSQWKTTGKKGSLAGALETYQDIAQSQQAARLREMQMEALKKQQEKASKQEALAAQIPELLKQYQKPAVAGALDQGMLAPSLPIESQQAAQLMEQEQGSPIADILTRINQSGNYANQGQEMPLVGQPASFDVQGFKQAALPIQAQLDPMGTMAGVLKQAEAAQDKAAKEAQWNAYIAGLPPEIRNNPAAMAVFSGGPEFASKIGPGVLPSVLKPKEQKPVEYTQGRNKFKIIPDMTAEQAQATGLQFIPGVGAIAKGDLDKPQTIVIGGGPLGGGKPPSGYRYTKDGDLEPIPGGPAATKQEGAKLKDVKAYNATQQKFSNGIATIDEILAPENAAGFQANFGGYNAYATRMKSGQASDVRKKIDSLKSSMKAAGLEMMRQGGSIGQMTEKEWPIVEQMIAAIDPVLSEEEAKFQLLKVKTYMQGIIDRANEMVSGPQQAGGVKFLGFE